MRVRATRWVSAGRTCAVTIALICLAGAGDLSAQSRYNHWETIDSLSRSVGGLGNAGKANDTLLSSIVSRLVQRGQAYLDLYEYQRVLVRDHARMLDSVNRDGGPSFLAASYFLARALHELGDPAAAAAYNRAAASAPPRLRALAKEWASSSGSESARSWQQDLIDWRSGKAVRLPSCPDGVTACAMFRAIVTDDLAALVRLQGEMYRRAVPDFVETRFRGRDSVTVAFFDPLTMYLLGVTDYAIAARISTGRSRMAPLRGLALLKAGRLKEAAVALKASASAGGPQATQLTPYLGETLFRQGDRVGAEQAWRSVSADGANIALDVKSVFRLDSAAVVRQMAVERQRGLDRTTGRIYLARALLRFNLLGDAEEVLRAEKGQGSLLAIVPPTVLTVLSHTEYKRGQFPNFRDRYNFARTDLADLAKEVPAVRPLLQHLQELTQLFDTPSKLRDFDDVLPEELPDA